MKIVFSGVTKHYGSIIALKEVNLSIDPGEFVFLVGPSGAGKSTILKLILHQVKASGGEIIIGDTNYQHHPRRLIEKARKNIGVIFQDYQLIPDKTVEENISIALDIVGYPANLRKLRINEVLEQVRLIPRRHLFPSQLSGGELQRSALARALSVKPKLILADEPTGNLDPENSWNLIKLLKDINQNNQTTIIMTTHNYDIINSLDKRIITLDEGAIITDQTKSTIPLEQPKSDVVNKKIIKKKSKIKK